jgi:hypothetical protein
MPSGIGLHLNSLTSSISFKRDFQSTRVGNSEGTLASILGVEPLKSASFKGDQSDVCAHVGMGNEGPPVIASQSFGSGVASSSQRSQTGKQFSESLLCNNSLKVDTIDFPSLDHESYVPPEGSLSVTGGDAMAGCRSIIGQTGLQEQQTDLFHQSEVETPEEFLDSPQSFKKRR